jgi:hypothetical protein
MAISGKLQKSAALTPGKESTVPTKQEAGWAPNMVWTFWRIQKRWIESLLSLSETETQMIHPQYTLHYPGSYASEIKVLVFNQLHAMCEDVLSKWRNAHMTLSTWRSVVSFMPQLCKEVPRTLWMGGRMVPRTGMQLLTRKALILAEFESWCSTIQTIIQKLYWMVCPNVCYLGYYLEDSKFGYSKKKLCMFAELHKATISFTMSVPPFICLPVCMEQLSSHLTDFHEIWYLTIFSKSVMRIQVWFKSDKCNRYFPWKPMYFYNNWISSC